MQDLNNTEETEKFIDILLTIPGHIYRSRKNNKISVTLKLKFHDCSEKKENS